MHQALYRKYRPASFSDVCGQSHITDVLRYEVESGSVSHAYLFCGSRGTGKTTCAKILAKAVNCLEPKDGSPCGVCAACRDIDGGNATDVIEMDAASNNGVDAIRQLCEEAAYTPAMLKKKVYIIDEVHMLSQGAFNALLKTIEEPPEHVIFILATTELQKIPATIISRCQRFDFRRIDMKFLTARLSYIAEKEQLVLTPDAAALIARQAQGGMRDAIGLMELCGAGGAQITAEQVEEILGLCGYDKAAETLQHIAKGDMGALFAIVSNVVSSSKDLSAFWQELLAFVRDMLVAKYAEDPMAYLDLTKQEYETLTETAKLFTLPRLIQLCSLLDDAAARMARTPQTKRMTAELTLLKMCRPELDASVEALSARLSEVENKLALMDLNAIPRSAAAPQPTAAQTVAAPAQEAAPVSEAPESMAASAPAPEAPADNPFDKVRDISEAVGRLDGAARSLAGFLMSTEAYVSRDGKALLLCAEGFAATMLDREDARSAIADAFALAKITDGRAAVQIQVKKAGKNQANPADEIGRLL